MTRRLHIGGTVKVEGWEVLSASPGAIVDHVGDATDLSCFGDSVFDEIYASQILVRLDYREDLEKTLKEWARVLAPGGKLSVSVPDLETLAKLLLVKEGLTPEERFLVMRLLFGEHADAHDYHRVGLNEEFLAHFLEQAGFTGIERVKSFGLFEDTSEMLFKGIAIRLNMVARKPALVKTDHVDAKPSTEKSDPKLCGNGGGPDILARPLREGATNQAEGAQKILLVVCRQTCGGSYQVPLGIGYISASLKRAGHSVSVLNPNHSVVATDTLLRAAIDKVRPDFVGFGGMAFHLADIKKMVAVTRQCAPQAKIMLGGPVVSAQPRIIMSAIPEADFGVIGEGEHGSVELVAAVASGRDLSSVLGIAYRVDDAREPVRVTSARPVEEDLDALPLVDYEGLGMDIYTSLHRPGEFAPALVVDEHTRVLPIMTSRGCPYSCTFCCHESAGRRYRVRSLDAIFEEIRAAKERYGINAISIYDDLFCLKRSRLEEFCQRIAGMGIRWQCSLSAAQVEPELLKKMRESGCCCVGLGVESMSDTVLKSMKKGTTKKQVEQVLAQVYEAKIGLWSNLIFGDPAETTDTVHESLEWFANHPEYNFRFAYIGYHPGSKIYDDALSRGLIKEPANYLLSGNCEINATAMSQTDYIKTRLLANRYFQSFGFAGKLLELDARNKDHIIALCRCPYCGANATNHTIKGNPSSIACVNCPDCNRSFRVPVVGRVNASAEAAAQLARLRALMAGNQSADTVEKSCHRLLSLDPANPFVWVVLHGLAKALHKSVDSAIMLEHAIVADPYNPVLFERMTEELNALGATTAAIKYRKKAEHLRAIGVTETAFIDIMLPEKERKLFLDQQLRSLNLSISLASFTLGTQPKEVPSWKTSPQPSPAAPLCQVE